MERHPFCRYRIEGTLTTRSPLHVGSGMDISFRSRGTPLASPQSSPPVDSDMEEEPATEEDVRIMAVITDGNGRAYLPATTLKGRLHQWASQSGADPALVRELFGTEELGGRLLFRDAMLQRNPGNRSMPFPFFQDRSPTGVPLLYWEELRHTFVMAGTVLNRITRTAEKNKLYHYEVVPVGTTFKVILCGEALTDEELAFLLEALEQFKHPDGLSLGGFTSHGFGALSWKLEQVTGLATVDELNTWLAGSSVGYEGFPEISQETVQEIRSKADLSLTQNSGILTLKLEIGFEGPFMINDPSQCYGDKTSQQGGLSHAYLKDDQGKVVLTAKSLHGALRAQAERIVRTLARGDVPKKACYIDTRDAACSPITGAGQVKNLCLTCRLFGGNGWRSPLTISNFSPVTNGEGEEYTQEFVAIDRFTGGAAEGKKFKAHYCFGPTLAGQLKIDLNRIEAEHAGLLILTLRDLIEGDIPLGFGRSKGFGACQAGVKEAALPGSYPPWFKQCLDSFFIEDQDALADVSLPLSDEQVMVLQDLVETFIKEVNLHAVS